MQTTNVEQALRRTVAVEIRNVFGVLKAYPKNDNAHTLALIAGSVTLTHRTLQHAETLGFEVVDVTANLVAWGDVA
jgi:hypothetical protein